MSNNYEENIANLKKSLTGDPEDDLRYLQMKLEKYAVFEEDSVIEFIKEEIARLEIECNKMQEELPKLNELVIEAEKKVFEEKNLSEAKELLEDFFLKSKDYYISNDKVSYYSFYNPIEFILYLNMIRPKNSIKFIGLKMSKAYLLYGFILVEEKKLLEAGEYLMEAIIWNPMNVDAMFEIGEIYKINNDWENMKKITMESYKYIYRPDRLARYYRNLGYYYAEQKDYDLAYALYFCSLQFQDTETAHHELGYINHLQNNKDRDMVQAWDAKKLFDKVDVKIGCNPDILGILTGLYDDLKIGNDNKELIEHTKEILYGLTSDDQYKEE